MKVYELLIDETQELEGVNAISLVSEPAIESNFIAFSKDNKPPVIEHKFKTENEEKRIVTGPVLIPEMLIYRRKGDEEYYVFLKEETIRKASELYFKRNKLTNATIEHSARIDGVTTVESWIVIDSEKDKSNALGLPQTKGTWMASMKIDNESVWDEFVKTGLVKGFSIEAFFSEKIDSEIEIDEEESIIEEILSKWQ